MLASALVGDLPTATRIGARTMGRLKVVRVVDDLTKQEISEDDAYDVLVSVTIKRGDDVITRNAWDLCLAETSKATFEGDLRKYTQDATEVPPEVTKVATSRPKGPEPRTLHMRDWWENLTSKQLTELGGLPVMKSNRGRVPETVIAAYDANKPEGHIPPTE